MLSTSVGISGTDDVEIYLQDEDGNLYSLENVCYSKTLNAVVIQFDHDK